MVWFSSCVLGLIHVPFAVFHLSVIPGLDCPLSTAVLIYVNDSQWFSSGLSLFCCVMKFVPVKFINEMFKFLTKVLVFCMLGSFPPVPDRIIPGKFANPRNPSDQGMTSDTVEQVILFDYEAHSICISALREQEDT